MTMKLLMKIGLKVLLNKDYRTSLFKKWFSNIFLVINGYSLYVFFQTNFGLETYVEQLPKHFSDFFFKFRTTNHCLPIETDGWSNNPYNERLCKLCNEHIKLQINIIIY